MGAAGAGDGDEGRSLGWREIWCGAHVRKGLHERIGKEREDKSRKITKTRVLWTLQYFGTREAVLANDPPKLL